MVAFKKHRMTCGNKRFAYRKPVSKPAIRQPARRLNVHPEALRNWIRQDEGDRPQRL